MKRPIDALEKVFHEPNRLAIMSTLCASGSLTFKELKEACDLTDGNLNRHLRTLTEAGTVTITKKFVGSRPQTTVNISKAGLKKFSEYLEALTGVLNEAKKAIPETQQRKAPLGKLVQT